MVLRLTLAATILACGMGLSAWRASSAAASGVEPILGTAAAAAMTAPGAPNAGDYSYVGSKKCKKCHLSQHKSWAKTKMGKTFDTLKSGKSADIKEKFEPKEL